MSIFEKLASLNLPNETTVSLSISEGTDVFVHNETEVETAINGTGVISEVADLITTSGLNVTDSYGHNPIECLRDEGLLDDYNRGDFSFGEFVSEAITDNFYDQEFIEYSTERYDHKRGFTTLSADFQVSLQNLLEVKPFLAGWEVSVPTENGTLTLS